jgi:hypothetical protein
MSETRTENPSLDAEDWEIAFEVYKEHPLSALTLAYHLMALRGISKAKSKTYQKLSLELSIVSTSTATFVT